MGELDPVVPQVLLMNVGLTEEFEDSDVKIRAVLPLSFDVVGMLSRRARDYRAQDPEIAAVRYKSDALRWLDVDALVDPQPEFIAGLEAIDAGDDWVVVPLACVPESNIRVTDVELFVSHLTGRDGWGVWMAWEGNLRDPDAIEHEGDLRLLATALYSEDISAMYRVLRGSGSGGKGGC